MESDSEATTGSGGSETADARAPAPAGRRRALAAGDLVGRYTVGGFLGGGGMGEVYLARDPELERDVAIKVLREDIGGTSMHARGRFLREAQALARLNHPSIVAVYDTGTVGEQVWVAMERVGGRPLSDWMKGRPAWREVVRVFVAAGRGLEAAHKSGIIHRDFKPHNVMVGDDGRVVVLDFGLARRGDEIPESGSAPTPASLEVALTQTGDVVGTPLYMAPEQLDGGAVGERSDQYSFCLSLYEALFGRLPFEGRTLDDLARARQARVAAPAGGGAPRWLVRLVLRGLERRPGIATRR